MFLERSLLVAVDGGLHARPASELVRLAKSFQSEVSIELRGKTANAKSPVSLMLLGVKEGETIRLKIKGDDAAAAIERLAAFLGASKQTPAPSPADQRKRVGARFAIGPAHPFFVEDPAEEPGAADPKAIDGNLYRFRKARAEGLAAIERRREKASGEAAAILGALADVAADAEWAADVEARIAARVPVVAAIRAAGRELAARFAAAPDPYTRARAEDVVAVARLTATFASGRTPASLADVAEGAIVLADEISALDLCELDLGKIGGLVSRKGSPTSHAAIIARAAGAPAIFGCALPRETLLAARMVAIDAAAGVVRVDPDERLRAEFRDAIAAAAKDAQELAAFSAVRPVTRDGRAIVVAANIGSPNDIDAARAVGAMGVGLFRTEFLFLDRPTLPDENEQCEVYAKVAAAFAPDPVVIRTLDIGGDKPLRAAPSAPEDNPFLGCRGVRFCLDRPEIFRPQIRALLRAAVAGNVKVMLPMVADVEEIRAARRLIEECRAALTAEGVATGAFELGAMVETPAAALDAAALAKEARFFSIGTNDLTQYVMAADRGNPKVAYLDRADHPAVLAAIDLVCRAAEDAGIWVGVCGEAAARPDLVPELVRRGVSELSMAPAAVLAVKRLLTRLEVRPQRLAGE